jgi:hypothetical protein
MSTNNVGPKNEIIRPGKKHTIVFCVPGKEFTSNFFLSWSETITSLSDKYNIVVSNKYSPQVNFARAMCLGGNVLSGPDQVPFNGDLDYDVIMWLDSDMVFNSSMVNYLIEACIYKYPVVSGTYALEGGDHMCCVENWDEEHYMEKGNFEFMKIEDAKHRVDTNNHWVKCAYTGMGCMAIRKGVIEDKRIQYPWFFRDVTTMTPKDKTKTLIREGTSEDVSFIRNLIDGGIIDGVMVNLQLRFGHEKSAVY